MSEEDTNSGKGPTEDPRFILALGIIVVSVLGTLVLALSVIWSSEESLVAERIFSMVLPLLGTWVGTVLAYYFSRENFESASASMQKMAASISSMEKLASIGVEGKQIPAAEIDPLLRLSPSKNETSLRLTSDLRTLFETAGRDRMPVLKEDGSPRYIIHRSMIDRFIVNQASTGNKTPDEINSLTLKDLLDSDLAIKRMFENSFVTVAQDENLADAKKKMDSTPNCSDVFVTEDGTRNSRVQGWLTNWIIAKEAQV